MGVWESYIVPWEFHGSLQSLDQGRAGVLLESRGNVGVPWVCWRPIGVWKSHGSAMAVWGTMAVWDPYGSKSPMPWECGGKLVGVWESHGIVVSHESPMQRIEPHGSRMGVWE